MSLINKILGKLSLSFEEFIDEYITSKIQLQLEKKSLDFNLEKTKTITITIIDDIINTIISLINNLQNINDVPTSTISKANNNTEILQTFITSNSSNPDISLITALGSLIIFTNIESYIINDSASFELITTLFNNISNVIPEPNIIIPINKNIVALSLISIISSNSLINISQNMNTFIKTNHAFNNLVKDITISDEFKTSKSQI